MLSPRQFAPLAASISLGWACASSQQPRDPVADDLRSEVGWYDVSPSHKVLVTTGPGGGLRVLDFDSLRFAALVPMRDSVRDMPRWRWRVGTAANDRIVTFLRNPSGQIDALEWTDSTPHVHRFSRSAAGPFYPRDVRFRSSDVVPLAGVLLQPHAASVGSAIRRTPAAVIIQGSGANDRDNIWAYQFAAHLARSGVAVLLADKRGSGDSEGRWNDASFQLLADDALAGVQLMRSTGWIDSTRIGVVGLSQGGWIAPLVASRGELAFAVNVSGAAVTPDEQFIHEVTQDLRKAALDSTSLRTVLELVALGQTFAKTHTRNAWIDYSSRRDSLLRTPLAPIVQSAVADSADDFWKFWQKNGAFDPVPLWRSLDAPALVLYGDRDEQDNVPVARSVQLLRNAWSDARQPHNKVHVFSGTGHTMGDSTTGGIRRDVLELLSQWIDEMTRDSMRRSPQQ